MSTSDVYTIQSHKKLIIKSKIYSGSTARNTKQTLQLYVVAVSVAEWTKVPAREHLMAVLAEVLISVGDS